MDILSGRWTRQMLTTGRIGFTNDLRLAKALHRRNAEPRFFRHSRGAVSIPFTPLINDSPSSHRTRPRSEHPLAGWPVQLAKWLRSSPKDGASAVARRLSIGRQREAVDAPSEASKSPSAREEPQAGQGQARNFAMSAGVLPHSGYLSFQRHRRGGAPPRASLRHPRNAITKE